MSFNSQISKVRNKEIGLNQKCSHLRSCALLYAQLREVERSQVIDEIASKTGVNILHNDLNDEELERALNFLIKERNRFLENVTG